MNILALQRIAIEFVLDVILFPMWWYTGGVRYFVRYCTDLVMRANDRLAPMLWLKNLFVPMFGQYDWQGRLISFFMRLVNVIFREIMVIMVGLFALLLFFLWLLVPLFVVYMLMLSLS